MSPTMPPTMSKMPSPGSSEAQLSKAASISGSGSNSMSGRSRSDGEVGQVGHPDLDRFDVAVGADGDLAIGLGDRDRAVAVTEVEQRQVAVLVARREDGHRAAEQVLELFVPVTEIGELAVLDVDPTAVLAGRAVARTGTGRTLRTSSELIEIRKLPVTVVFVVGSVPSSRLVAASSAASSSNLRRPAALVDRLLRRRALRRRVARRWESARRACCRRLPPRVATRRPHHRRRARSPRSRR